MSNITEVLEGFGYKESDFNADQREEIREGLEDGLDVAKYAKPDFDHKEMMGMRIMLKSLQGAPAMVQAMQLLAKFSEAEDANPSSSVNFAYEELLETETALTKYSNARSGEENATIIDEIIDGWADLAFVALSGMRKTYKAYSKGDASRKVEESFKRVCEANFAKLDKKTGEFLKNKDGKIVKPDGWKPPSHIDLIKGE